MPDTLVSQPVTQTLINPLAATQLRAGDAVGLLCHQTVAPVSVFHVTGADAARFLQNRTSNDVMALHPGQGHLNSVLDKSGKIQGVFTLHALSDGTFWLLTETANADHTVAELLRFKILDDVAITPLPVKGFSLVGAGLHHLLNLPKAKLALLPEHGLWQGQLDGKPVTLIRHNTLAEPAVSLWVSEGQQQSFINTFAQHAHQGELPLGMINEDTYQTLRIEAGQLIVGVDYTSDTLLPETGLEQFVVNYNKGCYLGQETVARVRTYGSVPKALMGLTCSGSIPLGEWALVDAPDKSVVTITSSGFSETLNKNIALAYIGKAHRQPGSALKLVNSAGDAIDVTVQALPFFAANQNEELANTLLQSGLTAFANGNDDEAMACLTEAILLQPGMADAYESLGAILGRHEQYEDAIALMQHLEKLDPDRVMAQTNLSLYYMKLGDKDTAEVHKAKATTLTFKAAMAQKNKDKTAEQLAREQAEQEAAAKKQMEDRAQMFRDALQYNPDDPLGNFGLGSTLLELGDFSGAIEALQKTVGLPSSQSVAYQKLGQAYEAAGDIDKAIDIYQAGIQVASSRRDLMPLNAMQQRVSILLDGQ